MPNQTATSFRIARWDQEAETWIILARFSSYEEADANFDAWADKYPNAWVDILDPM